MDMPRVSGSADAPGRPTHSQSGQTLAVVAIMMVVLVALLGLVIDGGNVYAQRRQMQNAADAGALAGARAWAHSEGGDEAAARAAIQEYAVTRNGATSYSATFEGTHVTVTARKDVPTYFVRVIGISTMPVSARARAGVYRVTEPGCGILPLAAYDKRPIPGEDDPTSWPTWTGEPEDRCPPDGTGCFRIWTSAPKESDDFEDYDTREDQYGWLNLNGDGLADVELTCWVSCDAYPCANPESYPNPGVQEVENGSAGLMTNALERIAQCWTHHIVWIPVYDVTCDDRIATYPEPTEPCWDESLGNSHLNYHIVDFVPFFIEAVQSTGAWRYIYGHTAYGANISSDCTKASMPGFEGTTTVRLEPLPH